MVFDEHRHYVVSLLACFHPVRPLTLSLAPGVMFIDRNGSESRAAIHFGAEYEFEAGRVVLAPAVEIGFAGDDTMGYPIVTMYVTASEMKKALEVLTSIAPLKGNSYFLQVSGLKFTYNPHRMIFDRVTGIWLGDEEGGYEKLDCSVYNRNQYRIAANIYNATFLKIIGGFTSNILTIVPRDRDGVPIQDLTTAIIDRDQKTKGVQGLKEWAGLIEYMKTFPDTDRDGIPDVPEKYRNPLGRVVMEASWCPVALLRAGTWITWTAFSIALVLLAGVAAVFRMVIRKVRG